MKLIVEEADIIKVKKILSDYYKLEFTENEVKLLIEGDYQLATALYESERLEPHAREVRLLRWFVKWHMRKK